MVILRATSNLEGQKEDKGMMCSITPKYIQQKKMWVEAMAYQGVIFKRFKTRIVFFFFGNLWSNFK